LSLLLLLPVGARLMLKRPDSPPPRERHRRFRRRRRAGIACTTVEYTAEVIDMLIRLAWLDEASASDRAAVGSAISRLVADAARR
jgi:hypothetical protein